ncbi:MULTISPECIES: Imm42 family immunity protein [unclassified Dyella]|uniref:Imm42 family immunity protein n=1 Tax=unclassified Dyella TaxID=2634549 RepID=UPI000C831A90|nr:MULTISPECIES: Imm42 family immunity protein [unclassified Dyella]MDR3445809.1 Imm42 family immunity protein [Dyella sp.]PMQ04319.1 hypothetical protein DyAD56_15065 [Dyella sp. AD56]
MLFGEKKEFAVEVSLNGDYGGAWLFGRICFWIGGAQIGAYQLGTSLRDLIPDLRRIVMDAGHRSINTSMSDEEVIDHIKRLSDEAPEDQEDFGKQLGVEMPAQLLIRMGVDVFDSWTIYLFDRRNYSRITYWKSDSARDSIHQTLPRGYFDSVIREVFLHIDSLYEKET